jgi:hypothetical protein
MCKVHWNQYTAGLARDAKARKAAESVTTAALTEETEASVTGLPVTEEAATLQATSKRSRRPKAPPPVAEGEEVAG